MKMAISTLLLLLALLAEDYFMQRFAIALI